MDRLKKLILPQLFIIYTRYLIGFAFVFASIVKIQGKRFTSDSGADHPIDSAWHYFETMYASGMYWQFIGMAQLVAGFLLMTQRYSRLGAILFFPIIVNIFVITVSYSFKGTWVITGLMLIANTLLLLWEWGQIKVLFNLPATNAPTSNFEKLHVWEVTGLLLFLFTVSLKYVMTSGNMVVAAGICFLIGLGGMVWGLLVRRSMKLTP